MSSFELSPGVVVDPDRKQAYVMSPEGGIVAVDLAQGGEVWRSRDAAKPLTVAGDLLIGQAETAGPHNELTIVALDTRERGAPVRRSLVELPPGVQPAISQTLNRSFTAQAQPLAGDAAISWEFVERPLRGVASGPIEVLPGEAPPELSAQPPPGAAAAMATAEPGAEITVARGAVRVGLADGSVTTIAAPAAGAAADAVPSAPAPDLAPDERLAGVPEPQFLSADGRHVLNSRRVADDTVWDKYLWTIYDRSSGERLGELRSHVRVAPFFVNGTRVVYQTGPYARRVGAEIVDEPLQIRAADLRTGAPLWSRAVRDISDRDAPPP